MVESRGIEDASVYNERSLKTLARTIQLSQGQFSLILVRCNYPELTEEMRQRLHQKSTIEIQELILPKSGKRLYDAIANSIKSQTPKALMVLGLESVVAIDELLTGANRDRDLFKRDFAFPLILWMTDRLLHIMGKSAADLTTWSSPPIKFIPDPDFLISFQQETIEKAFGDDANFTINEAELEAVQQDLSRSGQELDPGLQASWEFILGRIEAGKNQLDSAIAYYQKSLGFWQQSQDLERQGILLLHLGLAYNRKAEQRRTENRRFWEMARDSFQQSLEKFEQAQRPELVAKHISQLGEVLRRLQDWERLQNLANKSLSLHQQYGNSERIAQDRGFLAEVALEQSRWNEANQLASQALETLEKIPNFSRQSQGFYRWLLARSQRHLERINSAIENLETARNECQPQFDPQQYIRILEELRKIYFERGEYKKAFDLKLEQQEIKSKYRLQAFIGAGRLQPQTDFLQDQTNAEIVEEIVATSGRKQDIQRLIERMVRADCKLTAIYGQSGVGKSSILQAGLVPTLQFIPFEMMNALPILVQAYHDWARDCGQGLIAGLKEVKGLTLSAAIDTPMAILAELRNNQQRNLLTVLIFDQFEEFFFVYQEPASRLPFYSFLSECLKIADVKVILSLREDYIHYLLECNRLENLSIIERDILSKNILYYLGNFSRSDAKTVIQTLTERSQLDLHDDLIEGLVEDLAGKLGEVRPIELQVVGAQLEKRQIATLIEYQKLGERAKEKLVEEYLAEVVGDCGRENKETAALVLYLLTNENNTRPQKTQAELAAYLANDFSQLELVLEIFVKSGLVLLVPASPSDRYQLVHDYLVPFIRKQQGAELLELREKLKQTEAENQVLAEARQKAEQLSIEAQRKAKQRIGIGTAVLSVSLVLAATVMGVAWQQVTKAQQLTKLERLGTDTLKQFQVNNEQIESLISAVENGKKLKEIEGNKDSLADYSVSSPLLALQQIVNNIRERNQLKGHQGWLYSVSFSPDGKTVATASWDKTARLWRIESLDEMLVRGCNWLRDYLENSADESEKHVCDGIGN